MANKKDNNIETIKEIEPLEIPTIKFVDKIPFRAYEEAAGFDLVSTNTIDIPRLTVGAVNTEVQVSIPKGFVGLVRGRSGNNMRGLIVAEGTVDSDYTGIIKVALFNLGDSTKHINKGDRVAQLVIVPYIHEAEVVKTLPQTTRGSSGFGSSGK